MGKGQNLRKKYIYRAEKESAANGFLEVLNTNFSVQILSLVYFASK